MAVLLPTAELRFRSFLISVHGDEFIYSMPPGSFIDEMVNGTICRWVRVREENPERIKAIAKSGYIDGIIYLAYLPRSEGSIKLNSQYTLCCYDGNHRRLAIREELSSNILVSILWTSSIEQVIKRFIRINTLVAISPSAMDTYCLSTQDKNAISGYINYLSSNYPEMSSKREQWNPPHFNVKYLMEQIMRLHKELPDISIPDLMELLKEVNNCYARELLFSKLSISNNSRKKCEESGLWMFCSTRDFDYVYILAVIGRKPRQNI